jgi:hypothetical protein
MQTGSYLDCHLHSFLSLFALQYVTPYSFVQYPKLYFEQYAKPSIFEL